MDFFLLQKERATDRRWTQKFSPGFSQKSSAPAPKQWLYQESLRPLDNIFVYDYLDHGLTKLFIEIQYSTIRTMLI